MKIGRVSVNGLWTSLEAHREVPARVLLSLLISFQLKNPGVLLRVQVFNIVLEVLVDLTLPMERIKCLCLISVLL
jgi:hypothetical protein